MIAVHVANVFVHAQHEDDLPQIAGRMMEGLAKRPPKEPPGGLALTPEVPTQTDEHENLGGADRFGTIGHVVETLQVAQQTPLGQRDGHAESEEACVLRWCFG